MSQQSHSASLFWLTSVVLSLLLPMSAQGSEIRLLAGSVIASQTGAGQTHPAAISADGRFVLLRSTAPNLVAGQVDTNGADDLFLRDRTTGGITLISHAAGAPATTADEGSWPVAMSPDGEWVLFTSWSGDLLAGLSKAVPKAPDVYLWRRSTAAITLVSHLPGDPLHAAGESRAVAMTPDGAFVMFDSEATGLVAGIGDDNGAPDVFRFSRASGSITLASLAAGAASTGNAASTGVDLSDDGTAIFFNSAASDLVSGDDNQRADAFVRVAANPVGRLMSWPEGTAARDVTPQGRWVLIDTGSNRSLVLDRNTRTYETTGIGPTWGVAISDDGQRALLDIGSYTYLHAAGVYPPLCLSCDGWGGWGSALSADGRFAAYWSSEENGAPEAFVYDAVAGASSRVLPPGTPLQAAAMPFTIAMSQNAAFLALASGAPEPSGVADLNGNHDAFAVERASGQVELLSASAASGPIAATLGNASHPTGQSIAGDEILFRGPAYLLDPAHPTLDVAAWAYRVKDGGRRLLSPRPGQPQVPAAGWLEPLALGEDGRALLSGSSSELVPGALPGAGTQLYLYAPATQSYRLLSARAGSNPPRGTAGAIDQVETGRGLGSRVLFRATEADLVAGLAPLEAANLFACDLGGGGCQLLSRSAADPDSGANRQINEVRASADASVAVFSTTSTNLTGHATSFEANLYRWRSGLGLDLVSRSANDPGQGANGSTYAAALSADGRFALAGSLATDLDAEVIDGNGMVDVYLADLAAGTFELVSGTALAPDIASAGFSVGLAVSDNGRFVLFYSSGADLVAGMTEPPAPAGAYMATWNLYVYDRNTRQKRLVSHLPGQPLAAAGYSAYGFLSHDGSRVAFRSASPHFLTGEPRGSEGLFTWDGGAGAAGPELVGIGHGGPYLMPGLYPIYFVTREFDGIRLPFSSFNGNLTPGDTNGFGDAFVALLDALFRDGFESGDTGAWSVAVP